MTETEFLNLAESALATIEARLEVACNETDLDVEWGRNGNVLEIECIDSDTKVIINIQAAMQELWIAAKSGGFHYRYDGQHWRDTRNQSEFFAVLSSVLSAQGGVPVQLA